MGTDVPGDRSSQKKDNRVTEQERDTEKSQGTNTQEEQFVDELTDKGAEVMRPERPRRKESRDKASNSEGEDIELTFSVPRLAMTGKPRR